MSSAVFVQATPRPAAAATPHQVCNDLSTKAANVGWDLMDEAGAEAFCAKTWVNNLDRFNACDGFIFVTFANKLKNVWNRFMSNADASWATWGPRGAGPEPETGTIVGGFKRTFFAAGINEGTSTVVVRKTGGQARAEITVCRLARNGQVATAERYNYASGSGGTTTPAEFAYTNDDNYLIGIVVDTPVSTNTFSYSVEVDSAPTITHSAPATGIADLHVHQYANLGYAGRFYWGDSLDPVETGLAREVINGDVTNPLTSLNDFANYAAQTIVNPTLNSVDANLLFQVIRLGKPTAADGFVTVGTAGYPNYADWPHHADTTHQQVHISWIEDAHTYGDCGVPR